VILPKISLHSQQIKEKNSKTTGKMCLKTLACLRKNVKFGI